jgi:hypothetical protein
MGDNQDQKTLLESISKIRKKFKTETEKDPDRVSLTFLDELNILIRNIFKDNNTDVYTALSPEMLKKWKKRKWLRYVTNFFKKFRLQKTIMFILLAVITGFLVSESLEFYAIDGVFSFKTYVKAMLTEVCFIFLAGYRAAGNIQTFFVSILRGAIFILMLFVISSGILFYGQQTTSDISSIATRIALLEQQIQEKQKTIDFYRNRDWPINVNIHERQKEDLIKELLILKERQIKEKRGASISKLVEWRMYGRAAFRVILLLISALITRRLFRF